MNKIETAKLLTIAAGFDNRRVDDVMTAAWLELLGGFPFDACKMGVLDHYRDPKTRHTYLTAAHILDRVEVWQRASSGDVEADVRSAKARQLIDGSWPKREPLPPDVAVKLSIARQRDIDNAHQHSVELETTNQPNRSE